MNAPPLPVERVLHSLPDLDWVTDAGRIARLSQDFSWFSPVLKRQLAGKVGEAAVRPRTEDEIVSLVAACARHRVPLTIRGTGTGNYGQAVPLRGGIVLDMSGYNAFLWARDGIARAQAGIRLADLEQETRQASGMELRCIPSTYRSATLGGLFGGGFGGVGSINWGPLAARGNVLGAKIITVEETPRFVEMRGAEALDLHHLWGTNGLVLELEIGLAPAVDWQEHLIVFKDFEKALHCGQAIAAGPGIVKREVAFFADPVPSYFKPLAAHLPAGCHALIVLAAPASTAALCELVAAAGGEITLTRAAAEVTQSHRTLIEYTWNHTTLVAFRSNKDITYLQCAYTPGQHLDQVSQLHALLHPEVQLHAEFIRNVEGQLTCSALPIVQFTTEDRLQNIMQTFRDHGVRINDPHVFVVEDGKAGGQLSAGALAAKRRFDPLHLLNPGKVRAWMEGPAR